MQKQFKNVKVILSFLFVIFMMCSFMSVGVSASGGRGEVYFSDAHYDLSPYVVAESDDSYLKEYLRKELIKCPEKIDLKSFNLPQSYINVIIELIDNSCPEIFHIKRLSYEWQNEIIIAIYPEYKYSKAEYTTMYNKCIDGADKILNGIKGNANLSDVQKALLIHDRLVVNCEYDMENYENNTIPEESYTMYGVLSEGVAVCQGYSEAYLYLLEQVGIRSYLCESETLNHAWNIVEIDGKEYHVDVTWDDNSYEVTGYVNHDNFLRSSDGIYSTKHYAYDYITTPTSTTYDSYFWQNSKTEFQLIGNEIYYIDNTNSQLKRYSDKTSLISVADYWMSSNGGIWNGNFARLSSDGSHLLYSKTTAVYSFDLSTKQSTEVWKPDRSALPSMSIYGFTYRDGKLICDVYNSPNFEINTHKLYQQQQEWGTVKGVSIKTYPTKTAYFIGDSFDPAGMTLHVVYTDASEEVISSDYTVASCDTSKTGDTIVKISYGNKTVNVPITVKSPSIQLSETNLDVDEGESKKLTATTIPAGQSVSWSSSNDTVSVSPSGTVTGVADGKAEITAQFVYNGYVYSAVCNVNSGCQHVSVTSYPAKASTCVEHGHAAYSVCNICGDVVSGSSAQLPLIAHDMIENEADEYIAQEATCNTVAVYYKSCSVCGEASSLTFNSQYYAPHSEEILPAVEPSCTQTGLTIGSKCTACGKILKAQNVIEKADHTIIIIPGKPATETETGLTQGQKCSVCGDILVKQTEIPKLDSEHTHVYDAVVTPPTCKDKGYTTHTCDCGYSYIDTYTDVTDEHTLVLIPGKAPTYEETGLTDGEKCSVCGKITKEQTEIPVIEPDHVHDYISVITPPTCTEEGFTTYTCMCGHTYTQNYVNATGHDIETVIIESTCIVAGMKYDICTLCDETFNTEVYPLSDHIPEIIPGKEATIFGTGLTEGEKCSVCDVILKAQEEIPKLPLLHIHTYVTVEIAPTCTEKGYKKHTCECGKTYEDDYVNAIGHDIETVTIVSTCTVKGMQYDICTTCDETFNTETFSLAPHTPEIIPGKDATETETGLTEGEKCSVCGVILKEQKEIPKHPQEHEHKYIPVVVSPTCTEKGYTTHTCICGDTYNEKYVDATGHDLETVTIESTCKVAGMKYDICTICDETFNEEILPLASHTPEKIPGKPATKTETGLTEGEKCSVCGVILKEQKEIPVLAPDHKHDYVSVVVAPTCTDKGYTKHTCICGDTYIEKYVDATGHDLETVTIESTCEVAGMKYNICTICDETFDEEILPLVSHTPEKIPGKPATETETGLTEGEKCSVCGVIFKEQKEIPVLAPDHKHDYVSVVVAPTCKDKGYTKYTCECGATYSDSYVNAVGHIYGDWKEVKAPEIGKAGIEKQYCSVCNEILNEREIPALEKPVSDKLDVKDDSVRIDNEAKISIISIKNKVSSIAKSISNENFRIVDKDGKEMHGNSYIGTGSKIQIMDNGGKIVNEYTVCVPNDVDGNGKTTAADARLALRNSAKMENIEGVYAQASDVTGDGLVTAADARKILRVSAGLEKP